MANKVKTIFANMSWLMVSQIITSICAFIWTIITARYLGVHDYGILGTATSFAVIFGILCDFGISTYLVRTISTDFESEQRYLSNALILKIFLSIFYMIIVFVALLILGWDNYIVLICLLFAFENLIKSFYNLIFTSFQAHEQLKYQAIANIILNVLTLVFIVMVTFTDYALFGIAFAYIIANIITFIYTFYALAKHIIVPKLYFNLNLSKKLIIAGIPFALSSLFYMIYYSIDMVMITQFAGPYPTGLYNSTYKLISVIALFYTIYISVVFPVMSKLYKESTDLLSLSFNKSIKYLSMVTVPISVGTLLYASDIIFLCYGNQYVEAASVLQILIWTICFLFINGACSLLLNSSHKEVFVTKVYLAAAIFNIVLNLILIPKYSVYGASVATVLSEIFILILELYMISKIDQLPGRHLVYDIFKIIISSIVMGAVLYFANLSIWLAVPIGIIVYFAVFIIIHGLDNDDKNIIHQILGR